MVYTWTLQICWLCLASKGASDMATAFTDVSDAAGWRGAFLANLPWVTSPSYSGLVGFHLMMVMGDLLHIWNLGIARDLAGSALRLILRDNHVFQGNSIEGRMDEATISLKRYAKNHGCHLRMKKLTKARLCWKSNRYPELTASGSDTHVVCAWLEELLVPHADVYGDICTLLWTGNRAMRLLYAAGTFFNPKWDEHSSCFGRTVCKDICVLGVERCLQQRTCRAGAPQIPHMDGNCIMPKAYQSNFIFHMDGWRLAEKISHTLELTASKSAQHRTLQRWLVAIPEQIRQVSSNPSWPSQPRKSWGSRRIKWVET